MGVRIHKEKKARHLLPGEVVNLWPAWKEMNFPSEIQLLRVRRAYLEWKDHRGSGCGCKRSRDGGIYTCKDLVGTDVRDGWVDEVLYQARTHVVSVTVSSIFPKYCTVLTEELGPNVYVTVKSDSMVTISGHLYDPDKDSQVQPPRGMDSKFFTFTLAG